jgi:hypothetical protein
MPKSDEDRGKLDQGMGVDRKRGAVVPEAAPEGVEKQSLGLVLDHVCLQSVNGPMVIENVSNQEHAGAIVSSVTGHFTVFFVRVFVLFLDYRLIKAPTLIVLFIVSKERVTKNYSNAKGKKYPIISYNFQHIDLWSMNFGS